MLERKGRSVTGMVAGVRSGGRGEPGDQRRAGHQAKAAGPILGTEEGQMVLASTLEAVGVQDTLWFGWEVGMLGWMCRNPVQTT